MPDRDWPNMPWSERTAWERVQSVLAFAIMSVVGVAMFLGVIAVLGMIIETQAQRSVERDRCLKRATNGYEIERCR